MGLSVHPISRVSRGMACLPPEHTHMHNTHTYFPSCSHKAEKCSHVVCLLFEAPAVTLLLIVVQLSEGEVAESIATFSVAFSFTNTLSPLPPPFRHVSLLPSPQQLKALEGV